MTRLPIILGVDPGSRITGWGIVQARGRQLVSLGHGTIRAGKNQDLAMRMGVIASGLQEVIEEHEPTDAAIEDVFVHRDPRAALKLGQARGAALVALSQANLPVTAYAPAVVKRAVTGSGRADKDQVGHMVRALLGLSHPVKGDAADALAVAICHVRGLGRPRR